VLSTHRFGLHCLSAFSPHRTRHTDARQREGQ